MRVAIDWPGSAKPHHSMESIDLMLATHTDPDHMFMNGFESPYSMPVYGHPLIPTTLEYMGVDTSRLFTRGFTPCHHGDHLIIDGLGDVYPIAVSHHINSLAYVIYPYGVDEPIVITGDTGAGYQSLAAIESYLPNAMAFASDKNRASLFVGDATDYGRKHDSTPRTYKMQLEIIKDCLREKPKHLWGIYIKSGNPGPLMYWLSNHLFDNSGLLVEERLYGYLDTIGWIEYANKRFGFRLDKFEHEDQLICNSQKGVQVVLYDNPYKDPIRPDHYIINTGRKALKYVSSDKVIAVVNAGVSGHDPNVYESLYRVANPISHSFIHPGERGGGSKNKKDYLSMSSRTLTLLKKGDIFRI